MSSTYSFQFSLTFFSSCRISPALFSISLILPFHFHLSHVTYKLYYSALSFLDQYHCIFSSTTFPSLIHSLICSTFSFFLSYSYTAFFLQFSLVSLLLHMAFGSIYFPHNSLLIPLLFLVWHFLFSFRFPHYSHFPFFYLPFSLLSNLIAVIF